MTLSASVALLLTRELAALLVVLQTLEIVAVRRALSESGVWRASWLREEQRQLPWMVRVVLGPLTELGPFLALLALRIVAALGFGMLSLAPRPGPLGIALCAFLLVSQLIVSARFRGTFNGGSDAMTVVVLVGTLLTECLAPRPIAATIGLGYIASQSVLSYFVAGIVKLRRKEWRDGRALTAFVRARRYGAPEWVKAQLGKPTVARLGSWSVLLLECAFPLALLGPEVALPFVAAALSFHLVNWAVLGLNRFVFAWAATYPAIVYVAGVIAARG